MSTSKATYDTFKVPESCPVEHAQITGEDNAAGIVMDIHKIPTREQGWDGAKNHDAQVLADRLVQLEKKVGTKGWTSAGALVPFGVTSPAYTDTNTSTSTFNIGMGNASTPVIVKDATPITLPGKTLVESVIAQCRAIKELAGRAGLVVPNPANPATATNNFIGTVHNGTSVPLGVVPTATITDPGSSYIPAAPVNQSFSFPNKYGTNDALSEAIAKLDYALTTEIQSLKNEINVLKGWMNEGFKRIDDIITALTQDAALVISPQWGIDLNGLVPAPNGDYVKDIKYEIWLSSGATIGDKIEVTNAAPGTYAGVVLMTSYPFNLTLKVQDIVAPYNPGTPDNVRVDITATDASGNTAFASKPNIPV